MTVTLEPVPAWKVTLAGADLTPRIAPRLISLSLSESGQERSDELQLELHDHDGKLALPPEGAKITVALGWKSGSGVKIGLVSKGEFTVDEVSWSGSPDKVTIRARSANLRGDFRKRKSRSWHDTTLGTIASQIAQENSLIPAIHPDLAARPIDSIEQANKSDMELLRDLGRRHDAVATIKAGRLIMAPVNATTAASGAQIGTITLTRKSGDGYTYARSSRENAQDGAEAQYHDQDSARRHTVQAGGTRRRRLKRVYAGRNDATAAANAENNRLKRAAAKMDTTLALGDATLGPNVRVQTRGYKDEVDAQSWRIARVEHKMDAGGFTTRIEMEVAVTPP